jgi:dihydrofolate reductase
MKVVAVEHLTLDGVMQSPGGPDEDRRGGFVHGGWAADDNDDAMNAALSAQMDQEGALLLGRFTYESFFAYWPTQKNNPFTDVLNRTQKYVPSRTLKEPLPWQNSTLLAGEATMSVARLKHEIPRGRLTVLGSGVLMQSLLAAELIDELFLMIHPVVLGSGKRLFVDGGAPARLKLTTSKTTPVGVFLATYEARW